MTPLMVDIVLLVLGFGLIATGWHYGLIRTLGSLIGLVASIIVAVFGATWIENTFGFSFLAHPLTGVILFLTLALIVSQIAGWLVNLLDLARKVLSIIPFVGLVNSLGGAFVGLVQAAFVAIAFSYVTVQLLPDSEIRNAALESEIVGKGVDLLYNVGLL